MKKRFISTHFQNYGRIFSYTSAILTVGLFIQFGCASKHSVREIREGQGIKTPLAISPGNNKAVKKPSVTNAPKEAMTKQLFMQSKRPNIELPFIEGAQRDEATGAAIVKEQVSYVNAESIAQDTLSEKGKPDITAVQHLSEVVVTARSRFTPERNGRVNVDFVVKVPKELLSSKWRVTLNPKIIHNDSIVPLKPLVLKGQEFYDKQKQDYQNYENYLKSIVNKSAYDSVFLDRKGIREDISFRQNFYYEQYYKDWSRQMEYENWKKEKANYDAYQTAAKIGYGQRLYHESARKATKSGIIDVSQGRDTTGITAYYRKEVDDYLKRVDKALMKKISGQENEHDAKLLNKVREEYSAKARERVLLDMMNGKDTVGLYNRYMRQFVKNSKNLILDGGVDEKKMPSKFKEIYVTGRTLDKVENRVMTDKDSIEIASHRYLFEDIAFNEMKKERKDEVRDEMIPFPFEKGVRLDSIVGNNYDFVYHYTQDYPVTQGLKSLRLVMNAKIEAIDQSAYTPGKSDTLSYFIASLAQLVDPSLVYKETKTYRNLYKRMPIYPTFAAGKTNFDIRYAKNRDEVNKVINDIRTYKSEGMIIDSVMLRASTALDGAFDTNAELSRKRVDAMKEYFKSVLGSELDVDNVFKTRFIGEDWNTLASEIQQRNDIKNKEEILKILTEAVFPDQTETDIKKKFPADFKIISDSIYPLLRKVDVVINMHRDGMTEDLTVSKDERKGYAEGLRLLQEREYWKALEILSDYPDYNTALALLSLGYNAKALEVLNGIPATGNTEYLRTILAIRAGNESQAIEHLLKACELDPSKAFRAPLDAEVADLVSKYNLQQQLNAKAAGTNSIEDNTPAVKQESPAEKENTPSANQDSPAINENTPPANQ